MTIERVDCRRMNYFKAFKVHPLTWSVLHKGMRFHFHRIWSREEIGDYLLFAEHYGVI